ncbi:class I SAM-dependent methyltransferase [Paenibacillus ginsengarvi]|uniref:Methyltransferase domain-containing protein n=1 Tax=Paenibacillus ginsengarvi TaxID=400777 RepID=A0A3B0CRP5_9BACL|nr:methyltransferase domain-containing protein [Paenibacillus ginsengarvi]RKN86414.1 methyltransferase domain-containing protein [Paenibacillus ginsengarvi]
MKKVSFLGEFLTNTAQVGSVIPSSNFLARKMLPPTVPWHKLQMIAELGPGTGVFTRHIEEKRSGTSRFILFEKNEAFRQNLQHRYPDLTILDDALKLGTVVKETGRPFDLIISGLPFANFPPHLQHELLRTIHDALAPDGTFVAFQYTLLLKKKFQEHFPSFELGYTWMNVPPAWVFKCKRR